MITWLMREKPTAVTSGAALSDQQKGIFYMHHLTDRIVHTTAFVTAVVEHLVGARLEIRTQYLQLNNFVTEANVCVCLIDGVKYGAVR